MTTYAIFSDGNFFPSLFLSQSRCPFEMSPFAVFKTPFIFCQEDVAENKSRTISINTKRIDFVFIDTKKNVNDGFSVYYVLCRINDIEIENASTTTVRTCNERISLPASGRNTNDTPLT